MTSEVAPARVEQPKATRWVLGAVGVVAIIGAALFVRGRKPAAGQAAPAGSAAEARPIPVVVATATQRDVPVFLDGLGNAVPLITVTVRPQVDGPLLSVLF